MDITDEGLRSLILAMFRYAAYDIRHGNNKVKKSAIDFLESNWFKEMCGVFSLNEEEVKEMILFGSKIGHRCRYE